MAQVKIKILPIYAWVVTALVGWLGYKNYQCNDRHTDFELDKLEWAGNLSKCQKEIEEHKTIVNQRDTTISKLKEQNSIKCDLKSIIIRTRDRKGRITEEREYSNSNE